MRNKISVSINRSLLTSAMTEGRNGKSVSRLIRNQWQTKIEEAQRQMISSYEENSITKEIDSGPTASNTSQTLNGKGNLFSFIGFPEGSNPTEEVKNILRNKINFIVKPLSNGKFSIQIQAPTKQEIYNVSPIPWNPGRSWVDAIEKGISGLGSYVYKPSEISRSGTGIQVKNSVGGRFANRSYISTILKEFERNILK